MPARKRKSTGTKQSAAAPPQHKAECFTIMPFGGWFDDYYATVFKPAIEAAGLTPCRADDLYRPSAIVHDIWNYTKSCKLVLADLTNKNPNVFYELGLAHAIAKPVILITESITDIPFDLRALRVLEYDKNDPRWGAVLRSKIEASIREILESPLKSVLPSFLEIEKDPQPAISPHERELLQIRQELDLVRREMRRISEPTHPLDIGDLPDELNRYMQSGYSDDEIAHRFSARGVYVSAQRIEAARNNLRRQQRLLEATVDAHTPAVDDAETPKGADTA